MSARYHIFTPSGFMVSGMSNARECELWDRYSRIMGQTREQLEKQGYNAVLMDRGTVILPVTGTTFVQQREDER